MAESDGLESISLLSSQPLSSSSSSFLLGCCPQCRPHFLLFCPVLLHSCSKVVEAGEWLKRVPLVNPLPEVIIEVELMDGPGPSLVLIHSRAHESKGIMQCIACNFVESAGHAVDTQL